MKLPASLTSRLVLTAVSLVALVSLLVGITTTLAMRSYLTNQLDNEVAAALDRALHAGGDRGGAPPSLPPIDRDGDGDEFRVIRGQGAGTLTAVLNSSNDHAEVLTSTGMKALGSEARAELADVPADRRGPHRRAPRRRPLPRRRGAHRRRRRGHRAAHRRRRQPDRQPDLARAAAHPGRRRRRRHHRLRGRTPPAGAAARGRRHRPRGQHAAAVRGRHRPVAAGARPADRRGDRGRPGRLPPSTPCSATSRPR